MLDPGHIPMTERTEKFVERWISQHMQAERYQLDGDFTLDQGQATEACIRGRE
jgi:hypothetical protein